MCVRLVAQSRPTLCDPMDCSPPVYGILQPRILEWVTIFSFRASSGPRHQTHVSCIFWISRQTLYHWRHLGSLKYNSTEIVVFLICLLLITTKENRLYTVIVPMLKSFYKVTLFPKACWQLLTQYHNINSTAPRIFLVRNSIIYD